MGEINLDQARAARAEAEGDRSFIFRGQRFPLPSELPYEVLEPVARLAANDRDLAAIAATMRALLGEEEHDRFVELRPSVADLNELVGALMGEYGLGGLEPGANGGGGGIPPKSEPSLSE